MIQKRREAFSLIELLIVIFLISLIYTFVFSYFETSEKKLQPLSPLTLKSTLQESGRLGGHTTLLCTDECNSCYLRTDTQEAFERYEENLELSGTEVYLMNRYEELTLMEYGRFKDQKVCLMLDFYPNGSSTKAVLKTPKGIYYLPSHFGHPEEMESLDDAKEKWLGDSKLASNSGDFY